MTRPSDGLVAGKRVIRLGNISKPTLTVYRPAKERDTKAAVVVCPGGGYNILAMDLEGTEVCEWLNSLGVTACLLKYRVPARKGGPRHAAPLQDAQRAVSLVRHHAKEWGLEPSKVGILGFSAGGNLSVLTATTEKRTYEGIDAADKERALPDFAILVYPAYLVNEKKDGLRPEIQVTKATPPMFFAHAGDDPVPVENSVVLYQALRKSGVAAELHAYATGGHGFGLRRTEKACTRWPERCEAWLRGRGIIGK